MQIGQIDLPEPLLDAQAKGELVIFAGAGVSVAPPSNYPQLKDLAAKIAAEASVKPQRDEPLDRLLGRLRDEGVPVHQKLCDLLSNPKSEPSSLHYDLLKLFPSAREVRLVTTNFDTHFSTAAEKVFDEPVATYYAPALPLGYLVDGIAYLHGSVAAAPDRIVLTDGDFGRAYLTEGWARRFLQDLFVTFTVLFVGYSHNDPVMNYLSRGLPPVVRGISTGSNVRRYALIPNKNHGHWEFLGIEPVTYQLVEGENSHQALAEAVGEWARISRMAKREHEGRIRQIAEKGPPDGPADQDYLRRALRNPERLAVFTRHARGIEWLAWVEGQKLLDPLFAQGEVDETSIELARWLAAAYAVQHAEETLDLVRRHAGVLNPVLWNALVERLASHEGPRASGDDLARWVAVLLHPVQQGKSPERLLALLQTCDRPEDEVSALLLFEYLTRPYLALDDGAVSRGMGRNRKAEPRLEGDPAQLEKAWKRVFRPRLRELGERLDSILEAQMEQGELLRRAVGDMERKDRGSRPAGVRFLEMAAREVAGARRRRGDTERGRRAA